jgi:methyltransferase-like protein
MDKYFKRRYIGINRNQRMIYVNIISEYIMRYLIDRTENEGILW